MKRLDSVCSLFQSLNFSEPVLTRLLTLFVCFWKGSTASSFPVTVREVLKMPKIKLFLYLIKGHKCAWTVERPDILIKILGH